jgi:hypothetical protein
MGPGHRRDTIDDHFCGWSHRKRIGLGMSFLDLFGKPIQAKLVLY